MSGKLLLDHAGAPASGSDIEYQRVAGGSPSISNARAARTRTSPCCFGACRCRPARLVGVGAFLVFLAIASLVGFIYLVAEATFYASLCGAIEALFVSLGVVWLVGATLACLFFKSAMSACNNARTLFRGPLSPNAKGVSSAWYVENGGCWVHVDNASRGGWRCRQVEIRGMSASLWLGACWVGLCDCVGRCRRVCGVEHRHAAQLDGDAALPGSARSSDCPARAQRCCAHSWHFRPRRSVCTGTRPY